MATRYNINDFALANPAYAGGTVSFYTVSGGAKTTTLATLYAASTGSTTLANPRTLDSDGKFSVPVYVEVPTVATVSGLTVADHDTGIMGLAEGAAATSAAAAAVSAAAALVSENNAETAETNAVAAVATIGHRKAASVGGTADAITAVFSPVFASLAASAGIVLAIPLSGANTTSVPTLAIDGFTAKLVVTGSNSDIVVNGIPGGDFVGLFVYDASLDKFQLLNPSGGVVTGKIVMSNASIVEYKGANVASAASCDIWGTNGNTVHITGTTQIDGFATATQAGAWKKVIFDDALILNQSANLNLNGGGSDITTAAGDVAFVFADTTTQMDVYVIRASGAAVVPPTAGTLTAGTSLEQNPIAVNATVTQAHGLGSTPALLQTTLVCVADELGWVAGQIYDLGASAADNGTNLAAFSIEKNATNLVVTTSSAVDINIINKSTNAVAGITAAKWKLVITPYKINT